jgi:hypothetical protein
MPSEPYAVFGGVRRTRTSDLLDVNEERVVIRLQGLVTKSIKSRVYINE